MGVAQVQAIACRLRHAWLRIGWRDYTKRLKTSGERAMAWTLIIGMAFTGIGILVGLYLPILAAQYAVPEKIRIYAITGAVLVVIGTALEIASVWPTPDVDTEQTADD